MDSRGLWVAAMAAAWLGLVWCTGGLTAEPAPAGGAEAGPTATSAKVPELEEASKLFRNGDFDGTHKVLQAARKKNPDLPPPSVIMAAWFAAGNQPVMVRGALEEAIASSPEDPEAYQLLGDLALRNRQFSEAGLLFDKVLALARTRKDPSARIIGLKRRALAGLAEVAERRRDWATAQSHLEALIAEDPKNASALYQLGRILFLQKKEDVALERLREAVKLDASLLGAEATLAQLYHQTGDVKNAAKWMLEAIKVNPRDAKTRIAAAQWSYEIGKLEQAEEQAKAAVTLEPDSVNSQLIRGTVALLRKDYKTAQEFLEKAHLQAPTNLGVLNNLALALACQEDEGPRRLALEYAQIAARVYADSSEAAATLGWALYRLGRLEEAESNLRKAVTMGRASPDAYYFLARVALDRGRKDEAKLILQSPVMKSSATYLMRKEAETLLEELSGR